MAMAKDSYSQALQNRRGASIDHSMVQMAYGNDETPEEAVHQAGAEIEGSPHMASNDKKTLGDTIKYPKGASLATPSENPEVAIADTKMGQVAEGSSDDHDDDESSEIRDHIIGHESPDEYDRMKESKPSTLGARVKMAAMKEKYEKV